MAIQAVTASFNGTQDSVAVTWPDLGVVPNSISVGVCTSDGGGAVDVLISALVSSGCTVTPTARFVGTVEIIVQ